MNKLEFLNKELSTNYTSLDKLDMYDWRAISEYSILSESFKIELFREFKDKVNWHEISKYQKLSENFIREFKDYVDWGIISRCQKLSENFIREFQDKVDWWNISKYQKLSEKFIRKFQDKVDWRCISESQKLSEYFMQEFRDKIKWYWISKYQKLSEKFIRKFQDKIIWDYILKHQKLSENFIHKFKNKVNWYYIPKFQKLSPEFIKEFDLDINKNNWLYKDTDFKKQQIVDCDLYECHEDYFIAYKAIRNDRYSHYNFQYQYLPNETYECHCDCADDRDSFGLSVWTYDKAKNYNNSGLIVKIKVRYENVGRLVHGNNKIRCSKIEILE